MDKKMMLIIGIVVGILVLIVLIAALIIGKKKKTQAEEPIHKDFDPSIENSVSNETQPVQTAAVQEEQKNEPNLNFESQPDMPQLTGEPTQTVVTPVVEANPNADTTPIMEISNEPVVETTPVVVEATESPVAPVIEEPTAVPAVEGIPATPEVAPKFPVEQPAVVDTTPIMEVSTEPVVETTPAVSAEPVEVPVEPVVEQTVVETPAFTNVGMVAEPVIETPVIEEPVQVIEEPVVIQEPVVIEEPTPEIAPTSEVQVLDNYEITLPEEQKAIEVSQNMSEQNIEKAPMFVTDMPAETPVVQEVQPAPITIDVPEVEEIQ